MEQLYYQKGIGFEFYVFKVKSLANGNALFRTMYKCAECNTNKATTIDIEMPSKSLCSMSKTDIDSIVIDYIEMHRNL